MNDTYYIRYKQNNVIEIIELVFNGDIIKERAIYNNNNNASGNWWGSKSEKQWLETWGGEIYNIEILTKEDAFIEMI